MNPPALYHDLSAYYDAFCQGIDYREQSAFALRVFSVFGPPQGQRVLDLACGTGQHLQYFVQAGLAATGLDYSAAMLAQAKARCPKAAWLCADMSDLPTDQPWDFISCFLYSLHYCPHAKLTGLITRLWQALPPGGVFMCNLVDKRGAQGQHLQIHHHTLKGIPHRFAARWDYPGTGPDLFLDLHIHSETQHWHDRHSMSALSIPEAHQLFSQQGFEVTLLAHDYSTFTPWTEGEFNAVLVAVRPLAGSPT